MLVQISKRLDPFPLLGEAGITIITSLVAIPVICLAVILALVLNIVDAIFDKP